MAVNENPKNNNSKAINSRKNFYDWLAQNIRIEGILSVERDTNFDDINGYRSGGIRLHYEVKNGNLDGLKEGILLKVGFDNVSPNRQITISSWAYEKAVPNPKVSILDNRALGIACYHPGYTFVEKLQTVATKYRQEKESGLAKPNLMRQYYDLFCLLDYPEVLEFIKSEEYQIHKKDRFPKADYETPISKN